MLKDLLQKFQESGLAQQTPDVLQRLRSLSLQIVGYLTLDDPKVDDDEWLAIIDQDMRRSMLTMFCGLACNDNLRELVKQIGA